MKNSRSKVNSLLGNCSSDDIRKKIFKSVTHHDIRGWRSKHQHRCELYKLSISISSYAASRVSLARFDLITAQPVELLQFMVFSVTKEQTLENTTLRAKSRQVNSQTLAHPPEELTRKIGWKFHNAGEVHAWNQSNNDSSVTATFSL